MSNIRIKISYKNSEHDIILRAESYDCNPSLGIIERAAAVSKKQRKRRLTRKEFVKGAKSVAKSVAGVGLAEENIIATRKEICNKCEFREGGKCGKCGCFLRHKTRLASESCPISRWGTANKR